jgi:DNA-binding NtrC family response regulator
MKELIRILCISPNDPVRSGLDQSQLLELLTRGLPTERFVLDSTTYTSFAQSQSPHLVLLHQACSDASLESRVIELNRRWPAVPILGILGEQPEHHTGGVERIPLGLRDFVVCPLRSQELVLRVCRILVQEVPSTRREAEFPQPVRVDSLIGESAIFQAQVEKVPLFAGVDATVLLQGETGTGKEVFARAIHYSSPRRDRAFIPINCAALPDQLFENELFGHAKGAYTSAAQEQGGLVLEAEGGTLFLDEVDALNPSAQAKLLRFVQYREYRPLGCSRTRLANVRIIAASNHDLRQAVAERRFREDLFHRLNVVQFRLPPLRERDEDILLLAAHFLKTFAAAMNKSVKRLSRGAQQKLTTHRWPGNVRELRNVIERALILETTSEVQATSLPDFQLESRLTKPETPSVVTGDRPLDEIVADFERNVINTTLEQSGFNLTKSAEKLKLSRHALRYRMQRLNLTGAEDDAPAPTSKDDHEP